MAPPIQRFSSPHPFLWRMILFLLIVGLFCLPIFPRIRLAFFANPGLNGLIIGALFIGVAFIFRMVIRLFPEIRWINNFRIADRGLEVENSPRLLAPMAIMLRERTGRMLLSATATRSILDSIAVRLDEMREISRYMTGLMVFLGLLGTFWGLLDTIASVGKTIMSLNTDMGNPESFFRDLKAGLVAPLSGMGIAFSSSLLGLGGSLVLGFLDLQAGQAQNRFYNDLEDWLSTVTDLSGEEIRGSGSGSPNTRVGPIHSHAGDLRDVNIALAELSSRTRSIAQSMEADRKVVSGWMERQEAQQNEMREMLHYLGRKASSPSRNH